MTTVIDILEEEFGRTLSSPKPLRRLASRVESGKVAWRDLCSFGDRFRAYDEAQRLPRPERRGELRPYMPVQELPGGVFRRGLELTPGDFHGGPERPLSSVTALKHHLLYCHAFAIDDPLAYFTDYMRPGTPEVPDARRAFANYLRFLAAVEPLVSQRALVLVEPHFRDGSVFPSLRNPLEQEARTIEAALYRDADFSDLAAVAGRGSVKIDDAERDELAYYCTDAVRVSLAAAKYHHLDFYAPFRFMLSGLRAMGVSVREDAGLQVRDLLSVPVPRLASLDVADVAAIRRDDENFARWRIALERALEGLISEFDPAEPERNEELLGEVRARMGLERDVLERKCDDSDLLRKTKAGTKDLALGAVVAGALVPVGIPLSAAALGTPALKLAGDLLWHYVTDRCQPGDRARLHHILLF